MSSRALIALALFALPFVSCQSISDLESIPKCAQQSAQNAFLNSGCGLGDPSCICKNQGFQSTLTDAVVKDCNEEDQQTVLKFSTDFCAKAGVQISVPETTAAEAPAASTPPPPPPPPPSSSSPPPPPSPTPSTSEALPPSSSEVPPPSSSAAPSMPSSTKLVSSSSSTTSTSSPLHSQPVYIEHPYTKSLPFSVVPASKNVLTGPYIPSFTSSYVQTKSTASAPSIVAGQGSKSGLVTAFPPYPYPTSTGVLAYNGTNGTNQFGEPIPFLGAASRSLDFSFMVAISLLGGTLGLLIL